VVNWKEYQNIDTGNETRKIPETRPESTLEQEGLRTIKNKSPLTPQGEIDPSKNPSLKTEEEKNPPVPAVPLSVKKFNKEVMPEAYELNEFSKEFFDIKYINDSTIATFDKLIRIDGYNSVEIKAAIKKGREDVFWRKNFQSPNKLRLRDNSGVLYVDIFNAIQENVRQKMNGHIKNSKNVNHHFQGAEKSEPVSSQTVTL
jgi:hypothetical protein